MWNMWCLNQRLVFHQGKTVSPALNSGGRAHSSSWGEEFVARTWVFSPTSWSSLHITAENASMQLNAFKYKISIFIKKNKLRETYKMNDDKHFKSLKETPLLLCPCFNFILEEQNIFCTPFHALVSFKICLLFFFL